MRALLLLHFHPYDVRTSFFILLRAQGAFCQYGARMRIFSLIPSSSATQQWSIIEFPQVSRYNNEFAIHKEIAKGRIQNIWKDLTYNLIFEKYNNIKEYILYQGLLHYRIDFLFIEIMLEKQPIKQLYNNGSQQRRIFQVFFIFICVISDLHLQIYIFQVFYNFFLLFCRCHCPRDSLFSWSSGFDNFTGFVNWGFLLLGIGGIRLLLENFIK